MFVFVGEWRKDIRFKKTEKLLKIKIGSVFVTQSNSFIYLFWADRDAIKKK